MNGKDLTISGLKELLLSHEIPIQRWEKRKLLDSLFEKIRLEDSILYIDKQQRLVRQVAVSGVDIYHRAFESKLYLCEDRQVFKTGCICYRTLPTSVGKERREKESFLDAAYRALEKGLGITEKIEMNFSSEICTALKESWSYPGLLTSYTGYRFTVWLPERHFKPEGYVEEQEDKTVYFKWRREQHD